MCIPILTTFSYPSELQDYAQTLVLHKTAANYILYLVYSLLTHTSIHQRLSQMLMQATMLAAKGQNLAGL